MKLVITVTCPDVLNTDSRAATSYLLNNIAHRVGAGVVSGELHNKAFDVTAKFETSDDTE